MHIFIDESGTFSAMSGLNTLCSIVVRDDAVGPLRRRLAWITRDWPREGGELKSRLLTPDQALVLIDVLDQANAIMVCHVIDRGLDVDDEIETHKRDQCEGLTKHLTAAHHPDLVASVQRLSDTLAGMSNQLYAQCVTLNQLVRRTVELATAYFAQRHPKELGSFTWVIDRKDPQKITTQEDWWRDTLGPLLQAHSLNEPLTWVRDKTFNYKHFERAFKARRRIPVADGKYEERDSYDIGAMVTRAISFEDSRNDILLQAIDILAGFMRRTLRGDYGEHPIIEGLGRLQIRQGQSGGFQSLFYLSFGSNKKDDREMAGKIAKLSSTGRSMMLTAGRHMLGGERRR